MLACGGSSVFYVLMAKQNMCFFLLKTFLYCYSLIELPTDSFCLLLLGMFLLLFVASTVGFAIVLVVVVVAAVAVVNCQFLC